MCIVKGPRRLHWLCHHDMGLCMDMQLVRPLLREPGAQSLLYRKSLLSCMRDVVLLAHPEWSLVYDMFPTQVRIVSHSCAASCGLVG